MKTALRQSWRALPPSFRSRFLNRFLAGITESEKFRLGFPTFAGLLQNIKANSFTPQTVVDVGAFVGNWSLMAASVFPSSQFIMIEANPARASALRQAQTKIGGNARYSILLLGAEEKDQVIFFDSGPDSSILPDTTSFVKRPTVLPMRTLDGFMQNCPHEKPMLLKLDVQGFELEVLKGGRNTLGNSDFVIMETSLLPYNPGAPLLPEVIAFMADSGFTPFDFCGQYRRQTDHTLFQTDVAFARLDSPLRAPRKFWLHEP